MEYSWAFAAARTFPELYQPSSAQKRLNRPTRSNSASGAAQARRGPRIPGHSRASSCSSTNQSSESSQPNQQKQQRLQHQHATPGSPGGEATDPDFPDDDDDDDDDTPTPSSPSEQDEQQQHQQQPQHKKAPSRLRNIRNLASSAIAIPSSSSSPSHHAHNESEPAPDRTSGPFSRSPRSPRPLSVTFSHTPSSLGAVAAAHHNHTHQERRMLQHATMLTDPPTLTKFSGGITAFPRTESVSSTSGATTLSSRTVMSSEPPWASDPSLAPHAGGASGPAKPLVVRNGRTFLSDPGLLYPLPVDLAELHRQTLRMLLLFQLFGGPVCSPALADKPPARVLEVGCGSGFWSMMCHRYYSHRGHADISFTGMDLAPVAPGASSSQRGSTSAAPASTPTGEGQHKSLFSADSLPDGDMKWRFVQHDMRRLPWPFGDNEFDLVMVKDMSLATPLNLQQSFMDEYIRVLRPGGVLEMWESDHTVRMLRPHVPDGRRARKAAAAATAAAAAAAAAGGADDGDNDSSESEDEHEAANKLGAYVMTGNTPLSAPLNNFLVEYNSWISRALENRGLSAVPCTLVGPNLIQEAESLTGIGSRRLAVPLSEVRWEREGVGGVVTKDGKSYIETKSKSRVPPPPALTRDDASGDTASTEEAAAGDDESDAANRPLTAAQAAMRRTALMTVVQQIQSLEGPLRDASGKSQDEWDGWVGKMTNDLVRETGSSWGECLEIGAWWARKKT